MKNLKQYNIRFISIAMVAVLFLSCGKSTIKKSNSDTPEVTLLSAIINNIKDDPGYGTPVISVSYNGKNIAQVVGTGSTFAGKFTETHTFNYNTAGQFIGTDITYTFPAGYGPSDYGFVHTDISYSGGQISEIKAYRSGQTLDADYVFKYNNKALTAVNLDNTYSTLYKINSDNNYYSISDVDPTFSDIGLDTFDNKKNIANALPYWQYFYTEQLLNTSTNNAESIGIVNGIFKDLPNTNNVLVDSASGGHANHYDYQYNADGYPSSSSITYGNNTQSYLYEYIHVK